MKPMTEKMTKPAKMLVALLVQVTIRVSLERRDQSLSLGVLHEGEKQTNVCHVFLLIYVCVYMYVRVICKHLSTQ
jgi:hypothetical protein